MIRYDIRVRMQLSIKECHKDWLNKLPFLASIYNDTLSKDLNLKIDDLTANWRKLASRNILFKLWKKIVNLIIGTRFCDCRAKTSKKF